MPFVEAAPPVFAADDVGGGNPRTGLVNRQLFGNRSSLFITMSLKHFSAQDFNAGIPQVFRLNQKRIEPLSHVSTILSVIDLLFSVGKKADAE